MQFDFTMQRSSIKLGSEALWVIIGQVLSVIILFCGVRLLTHAMSPAEYGKLAIIISIANGALYSIGQALKLSSTRYYSIMVRDNMPNWYWIALYRVMKIAFFVFFGIAICCFPIGFFLNFDMIAATTWALGSIFAFLLLINAVTDGVQNGARNRKLFAIHQILFAGGRFGLAFIIAKKLSGSSLGAMIGFVMAGCLIIISQLHFLKKIKNNYYVKAITMNKERLRQFYSYFWPLMVGGIFGWIQVFSDRWALYSLSSYADVGVYFVIYQTMYSLWIYVTLMLGNFLGTILFSKAKDLSKPKEYLNMLKVNEYVTGCFFLLVLAVFFSVIPLRGWLCAVLFAKEYKTATDLLPYMTLSGGIYGVGQQLIYSAVYVDMSSRKIIPIRLFSAVLAVIFHFAGAFFFGIKGVVFGGLAFSVSYIIIALFAHISQKRKVLKLINNLKGL